LLLKSDDGAIFSVWPQWTDEISPDPEIVLGGQKALLRLSDLMELAGLVDRLRGTEINEEVKDGM
jgi:Family of unknown function (DUF5372)